MTKRYGWALKSGESHPVRPAKVLSPATTGGLILFTVLSLAGAPRPAAAADEWNAGTGDWLTNGNWLDGTAPTNTDDANIDNGGTAQLSGFAEVDDVFVGVDATGTLEILSQANPGFLLTSDGAIGRNPGSMGVVTVDGVDGLGNPSTWRNEVFLIVGEGGTGTLTVSNGGEIVNDDPVDFNGDAIIGGNTGSTGTVTVTGTGSTWTNEGVFTVGSDGDGTLNIEASGTVTSSIGIIGGDSTSTGIATVTGADSTWTNSFRIDIGDAGDGTLTIANGGAVEVGGGAGVVRLATDVGSSGTLNIGGVAGILNAASVDGGGGNATLNFNHTDTNYFFTNDGTATGAAVPVTGSAAVNHINTGTTILTGTNTYTGGTTVNAGTLGLAAGTALANSGALTVNGGTFDLNDNNLTFGAALAGSGGTITLGTGTLTVGGAGSTFAGVISGNGALIKINPGMLTLTGNNTFTGNTTIDDGTLQIGNGGATGSIAGDVFLSNSALVFNRSGALTVSGVISGPGTLTKRGTGALALSGANGYGNTFLEAGALRLENDSALGISGTLSISGATTTVDYADGVTIGNPIDLDNDASFNVNSGSARQAEIVSESGGVTKTGAGTLILTANNTYSGGTTLSGGALRLENSAALGTGNLAIPATATVDYADGVDVTTPIVLQNGATLNADAGSPRQAGTVSESGGSFGITKTGPGTLRLTGANTYTGGTTISDGTLLVGGTGATGNILNNSVLGFEFSGSSSFAGDISGAGTLTKDGSGELALSGNNTHSGPTVVSAGSLTLDSNTALTAQTALTVATGAQVELMGFRAIEVGSIAGDGTIDASAAFHFFNWGADNTDTTFSGALLSANAIKEGNGTTSLSGASNVGLLTVTAGALRMEPGGSLGDPQVFLLDDLDAGTAPATLDLDGNDLTIESLSGDADAQVLLGAGTLTLNDGVDDFFGVIGGAGNLVKNGAGTQTLRGDNTFTGTATINAGTLQVGANGTSGNLAGNIVNNSALVFQRADAATYAGDISGPGGVTWNGDGTLALTGTHTHDGATTVAGGTLIVNGAIDNSATTVNAGTLRANGTLGAVTVNSGGTLGGGGIAGDITVTGAGTLAPGNSAGTLTSSGNLVLSSAALLNYELDTPGVVGGGVNDLIAISGDLSGNLTLDGTLQITDLGGFDIGDYTLMTYTGTLIDNGLELPAPPAGLTYGLTTGGGLVVLRGGGHLHPGLHRRCQWLPQRHGFPDRGFRQRRQSHHRRAVHRLPLHPVERRLHGQPTHRYQRHRRSCRHRPVRH